jgi:hypothetical protein
MLTIYVCSLGGRELYLIWVCVLYFCDGGGFSVIPTALARAYGVQYASENYGLLFSTQIIAGLVTASLTTWLTALIGYAWIFTVFSGFSGLGFLMALLYRPKWYIALIS